VGEALGVGVADALLTPDGVGTAALDADGDGDGTGAAGRRARPTPTTAPSTAASASQRPVRRRDVAVGGIAGVGGVSGIDIDGAVYGSCGQRPKRA
jgi:hypothetical protein